MKLNYPASEHGNFQILEDTIGIPHPYCITPRHVEVASNKFGGSLSGEAIKFAEQHSNAKCGVEGCELSFEEHGQAAAIGCMVDPHTAQDEITNYLKEHAQDLESKGVMGIVLVDKFSNVPKNNGGNDE